MKRLTFVVSLTNDDNDYQQEQAAAAEKAGRRLGVEVKIIHANNDALAQSEQLLNLRAGRGGGASGCNHVRTRGWNRISASGTGSGGSGNWMGCAES
jgi:ABC-type sugar transport system substrate-binding protein